MGFSKQVVLIGSMLSVLLQAEPMGDNIAPVGLRLNVSRTFSVNSCQRVIIKLVTQTKEFGLQSVDWVAKKEIVGLSNFFSVIF